MKNIIFKGEPGYNKKRKKKLMWGSITGFLLMFLLFITGYLIYGTAKNLITIGAVLVVLPTAKLYVQYLMLSWKNNADPAFYDKIKNENPDLKIVCELQVTGSEKNFEIMYLAISKDNDIVAYSANEKTDAVKFEKAVVNFLNYYNWDTKVKLFMDLEKFEARLKELSVNQTDLSQEEKEHMDTVFEKLSIMSI